MAEVFNCTFAANNQTGNQAKGLILDNKEGFYRDLGASLFNNNDYVRIAFAFTFNLRSNPNNNVFNFGEHVTNNTIANSFFMGLKSPNSNLPDEAGTTKFCGLWCPSQGTNGGLLRYTGYSSSSQKYGSLNTGSTSIYATGILAGSLTQPFSSVQAAINFPSFGSSPYLTNVGFQWGRNSQTVSYVGIQLTNNNVMTLKYYSGLNEGNTQGPYLSALRNFINNETFTSNSVTLTGDQYGNATSIFMYNPLNTTCIRVHAIAAAGFKTS